MIELNDSILIKANTLESFCVSLLRKIGLDDISCNILADSLIQSNLRGYDSHGVVRLIPYIKRFRSINWRMPEVVKSDDAIGLIDGNNCIGQICAQRAMNMAIEKATRFGTGIVGVKNSNHFGRAAYFSTLATKKNMIGFAFSNASSRIAPSGGKDPLLGNNPHSYAFPTGKGFPLILDISNSVVSAGKIRIAALKGEEIPEGWALDENGNMTQDPEKALNGSLIPIGDHKGYGITLVMEILCGILTGSGFAKQIERIDKAETAQHIGHLIGAINIDYFMSTEDFFERIDDLINLIKCSQRKPGVKEIFVPGELEHLTMQKRLRDGIPLQKKVVRTLHSMAEELGEKAKVIE